MFSLAAGAASLEVSVSPVEGDATATMQKAFDDCFRAGGGRVVVGKGEYAVKGPRLRSNTTLLLKSGAVLKASRDCDDYDILAKDRTEPVPAADFAPGIVWAPPSKRKTNDHILKCASRRNNAVIRILRARNVRIIGEPVTSVASVANDQYQFPLEIGNIGIGNASTLATLTSHPTIPPQPQKGKNNECNNQATGTEPSRDCATPSGLIPSSDAR